MAFRPPKRFIFFWGGEAADSDVIKTRQAVSENHRWCVCYHLKSYILSTYWSAYVLMTRCLVCFTVCCSFHCARRARASCNWGTQTRVFGGRPATRWFSNPGPGWFKSQSSVFHGFNFRPTHISIQDVNMKCTTKATNSLQKLNTKIITTSVLTTDNTFRHRLKL